MVLGETSYSVTVQWVPRRTGNDTFAVQPSLVRGCFTSLFLSRPRESAPHPVRGVLQDALAAHRQVADLEWVNEII
jgi:hypothetical protein